ncbi:hypothetical protein [Nocardioides bruguierae]|uniref:Uncharacterized protein n=1 Tax=Nocardioides bruguierae TaxID=2945102 RepID=A0A9X2IFQ2_9ACTN|nr:hypothetical protein [Nocardioides bruguierae]MCM0621293.1 hypothetical protein [Nocardioides bruguierae]
MTPPGPPRRSPADWPEWARLRQPDRYSCGPSSLVVARWCAREEAPTALEHDFAAVVLATHRAEGRRWPRVLGLAPWDLAAALGRDPGGRWSWWAGVRSVRAGAVVEDVLAHARRGVAVPVYVGDRWLPRHVVLVVGAADRGGWAVYDPARGQLGAVAPAQVREGRLPGGRWTRVWFPVLPGADRP